MTFWLLAGLLTVLAVAVVGPQRSMLRSNPLMLETEISERAQRHTTMR